MEAAERYWLRSGREVESLVNLSDVSIRYTLTPTRTMRCYFFFLCFLDPIVAVVGSRLFRAEFGSVAVLEAVRVTIHGVEGSSTPDN